jgi:hypothetical protein
MADTSKQLALEIRWLHDEMLRSEQLEYRARIAKRVEKVLQDTKIAKFLTVLERHNKEQHNKRQKNKLRNKSPFLLGPYLFHVFASVEERGALRAKMPVLDRHTAEVRAHLQHISSKCKALADMLRKEPQPLVALAARSYRWDAPTLLIPLPTIQSPSRSATIKSLDWVLNSAATSFDSAARTIRRAKRHRQSAKKSSGNPEIRRLTASVLVKAFRKGLECPYHTHVAEIAELLSGIETDADYVKKVEKRSARLGGQNPQK